MVAEARDVLAGVGCGLDAVPFPYKMTTICFVGPSAYAPVHSALTLFRDEFEAKIVKRNVIPVTAIHEPVAAVAGGHA